MKNIIQVLKINNHFKTNEVSLRKYSEIRFSMDYKINSDLKA